MVAAELYRRQTLMPAELLEPLTLAEVADAIEIPEMNDVE